MSERVIPLVDQRLQALPAHLPHPPVLATGTLAGRPARPLHDLRISVTDRCNFRCSYCMPKEVFNRDYPYLPQSELLTFEEITRLAHVFTRHGVRKLRITGGEPLLRKHLPVLVGQLAALRTLDGEPLEEYIKPVGGGYFFALPGARDDEDYLGATLMQAARSS